MFEDNICFGCYFYCTVDINESGDPVKACTRNCLDEDSGDLEISANCDFM